MIDILGSSIIDAKTHAYHYQTLVLILEQVWANSTNREPHNPKLTQLMVQELIRPKLQIT